MPVNSGGDKSGKASGGGPFGFLNKPSKQVAAKKAKNQGVLKLSKPAYRAPKGTLQQVVANVAEATKTTAADPKAGTRTQRKAVRKSYDKLSPGEKQQAIVDAKPGTVKGDTILRTHSDRVSAHRDAKSTLDDTIKAITSGSGKKGGGVHLASLVTAGVDAVLAPAAIVAAKALPGAAGRTAKLSAKISKNGAVDAVDIPLNTPASLYHLGSEAAHGHVKQVAKDLAAPYVETAKHPIKSLVDHPVNTALLVGGAEGAIGKAGGMAARSGALGERAAQAASTVREATSVPGTALRDSRAYSPDVIRKGVQVASEKRRAKTAVRKPTVMSDKAIRQRVDAHVAAHEDIRRTHRTEAVNAADNAIHDVAPAKRLRKAKATTKPSAGTTLAVQGMARTQSDLQAYLAQLEQEAKTLKASKNGARIKANKTARIEVRKAIGNGDARKGADRYTREVSLPLQKKLTDRGLINKDQAERARLIPYATSKMGAKYEDGKLVAHDGSELTNEAIQAHMHEHGVPEPGYVTNAPNQRGARNFYVHKSGHEPVKVSPGKRTGKAITQGTADLHPDVLVEGAARAQGLVDAADSYNAFLKEFGARGGSGKVRQFQSYKQALAAAEKHAIDEHGNEIPGAVRMRPVQINPFAGRSEQLHASMDHINGDTHTSPTQDAVQNALADGDAGKGPWTLVPEAAAEQMRHHLRVTGTGVPGKAANVIGSRFRQTVLATNPKWLVGNSVEAALRSMIAGAGPTSYMVGRGALKRLEKTDPEAALEAKSRMVGGGHMSMNKRVQTFSGADQFAGSQLAGVATALGKFWRAPGPKQVAAVWHGYTDFVFNTLNGRIETQFQTAMLGKALKRSPLMSEHTVKLSKAAMDDAAKGLRDTNTQAAFGREVDRMYGAYSKFSPTKRHLIAGYTPFVAWAINATNFLYHVLPADHPVLTSVLASANLATEQWRRDHGLKFGQPGAPFYLQGSIPEKGGFLRVAKFTPFGVASSPSGPAGTLAGSLLPQFASVIQNLQGRDWKGQQLKPGQSPALTAAVSLIEGTVPIVGQAMRIKSNPNGTAAGVNKELNPLFVVSPKGTGSTPAGTGLKLGPGLSTKAGLTIKRSGLKAPKGLTLP